MAKVVVKDNHLNFGGVTYFRGHAEEVRLGSYGEKRTPLTKMNYLEVKGEIPVPKIAKALSTVVEIDTEQTSKKDFTTTVAAIIKGVPVKLNGEAAFEKLVKQELKLVKFAVSAEDMKKALNDSPAALEDLRRYGKDARIAHQFWVVVEEKVATQFDNEASVDLSVGKGVLQATVGGKHGTSGTETVQVGAGTGFAYLLAKIEWDADKRRARDLDNDQWSFS
jgi:hypothetical protein